MNIKNIFVLINIINIINSENINNIYSKNEFIGVYIIKSFSNDNYFELKNNKIVLSNNPSLFYIKKVKFDSYFLELAVFKSKLLGINKNSNILGYDKNKYNIWKNIFWKLIHIFNDYYIIKNELNDKFIYEEKNIIKIIHFNSSLYFNISNNNNRNNKLLFKIIRVYNEANLKKKDLLEIQKEQIDIVIKYIDLTDKNLNRSGFNQTYKDFDNEELRFSLRSVLYYIPWVRKIYILMPNEKVAFLKDIEEINEKIIYVKDKDLLGFESSNIQSFLFNLDKMEKFGLSKNFIYMEDDCFIGKRLKKQDFFYFDKKIKKVKPYVISWKFYELNITYIINEYNNLMKLNSAINAHSKDGFLLQRLNTEKFFIDNYNFSFIELLYTHNAIPENIDDLKKIHKVSKKYKYINETINGLKRNIFSLCHEHFVNLFQLNINKRKVHPIISLFVKIEKIKGKHLNKGLFVINTGGNHKPTIRQYKIQRKIMEKRFPFKNKYEILNDINIKIYIKIYFIILKIYIFLQIIKIFYFFIYK